MKATLDKTNNQREEFAVWSLESGVDGWAIEFDFI